MKGKFFASLLMACLPWLAVAQSTDDLYFVPKKAKKEEVKEVKQTVRPQATPQTTYAPAASAVVVKDVRGNTRDVDEYNRRYTSRDNNFSVQNDTLYIEEKPYNERGEWVNGDFQGSQEDYEYAMRIVRFRNPRYAIPVSSPLYWDVVYGAGMFPSWDWNVYDDGLYAYVFPTSTNRLWWDWRFSYGWGWGWHAAWHYNHWYAPYHWGGYWGYPYHHHHYYYGYHAPHYAWGGGYHHSGWTGRPAYTYDNRRGESRRVVRTTSPSGNRVVSGRPSSGVRVDRNGRTGGRVVSGTNSAGSVRSSGVRTGRNNGNAAYTRPSQPSGRGEAARPGTTNTGNNRGTYRNSGASGRMQNAGRDTNRGGSSYRSSGSSSGSFRSSGMSSGGGRSSSSGVRSGGGGARRR